MIRNAGGAKPTQVDISAKTGTALAGYDKGSIRRQNQRRHLIALP